MKINKDTPIQDIILIVIFIILLFIPMLKIDKATDSPEENKTLASWKPLITNDKKINSNFGYDFNAWFSDRFNQRKKLIKIYNYYNYTLFSKVDRGWYDKNKLVFIYHFEASHFYNDTIKFYISYLLRLNEILKKKNIKLYIIICPQRPDIEPITNNPISKTYSLEKDIEYVNYLRNNKILNIIYPVKELKKLSENKIAYYKASYHWTDDSAFLVYQELMEMIKKDFPFINSLNNDNFNYFYDNKIRVDYNKIKEIGDDFIRFGIPDKELDKYKKINYKYYQHKNIKELNDKFINENFRRINYFYYPKGQNLRVVMIGPSTIEAFSHFIPFTFKNVKKIRINIVKGIDDSDTYKIFKYYEKEIFDYNPDIIIFCFPYFSFYQLPHLFERD